MRAAIAVKGDYGYDLYHSEAGAKDLIIKPIIDRWLVDNDLDTCDPREIPREHIQGTVSRFDFGFDPQNLPPTEDLIRQTVDEGVYRNNMRDSIPFPRYQLVLLVEDGNTIPYYPLWTDPSAPLYLKERVELVGFDTDARDIDVDEDYLKKQPMEGGLPAFGPDGADPDFRLSEGDFAIDNLKKRDLEYYFKFNHQRLISMLNKSLYNNNIGLTDDGKIETLIRPKDNKSWDNFDLVETEGQGVFVNLVWDYDSPQKIIDDWYDVIDLTEKLRYWAIRDVWSDEKKLLEMTEGDLPEHQQEAISDAVGELLKNVEEKIGLSIDRDFGVLRT